MILYFLILSICLFANAYDENHIDHKFCRCRHLNNLTKRTETFRNHFLLDNELQYIGSIYRRVTHWKLKKSIYDPLCTGVLINENFILTSEACLDLIISSFTFPRKNIPFGYFFAVSGHHDMTRNYDTVDYSRSLTNYFFHPSYKESDNEKTNLAIIQVDEPFIFNLNDLVPACLPDGHFIFSLDDNRRHARFFMSGYSDGSNKTFKFYDYKADTSTEDVYLSNQHKQLVVELEPKMTYTGCGKDKFCARLNSKGDLCYQTGSPLLYYDNYERRLLVIGIINDILNLKDDDICYNNTIFEFTPIQPSFKWIKEITGNLCRLPETILKKRQLCRCDNLRQRLIRNRMINGNVVESYDLKWVAGLYVRQDITDFITSYLYRRYEFHNFCTGTILNRNFVLTAAHCSVNIKKNKNSRITYMVGAGLNHELKSIFIAPSNRRIIEKFINHPKYSIYDLVPSDYDFALVKLVSPFQFNERTNILPACLLDYQPLTERYLEREILIMAGYGRLRQSFRFQFLSGDNRLIYAFDENLTASMCYGDSGSGVHKLNHANDMLYVIGVATGLVNLPFDTSDCSLGSSSIINSIYPQLEWITDEIGMDRCVSHTYLNSLN